VKEINGRKWEIMMIGFGLLSLMLSIRFQHMGHYDSSRLLIVGTVLFEVEAGLRMLQRYSKVFDKPKRKRHN
jgi:hypothetical protein